MIKLYFPGANTGRGFVSRFGGIVPPWEKPHYTYILKGGPGVGKNTLMRKVAKRAVAKGYAIEEFRCASDPDSLDAVRVPDLGIVLLDGTAPHSIDPRLPGIEAEILDLGRFLHRSAFAEHRTELENLFAENKACYRAAYALLGAAHSLHREAIAAADAVVDRTALQNFLTERFSDVESGANRALFVSSATPKGLIHYEKTHLPPTAQPVTGPVGELVLRAAAEILAAKSATVGFGFIDPEQPHSILAGEKALVLSNTGNTLEYLCNAPLPQHVAFCMQEMHTLAGRATEVLGKALALHDRIEALYRPYVDYEHVNKESEKLLDALGI